MRSSLFGACALVGALLALTTSSTGSAYAAWSDPATFASSSSSTSGLIALGRPEQAVLADGTSVVGWILDSPAGAGTAALQARTQARAGGEPGPLVTIASASPPNEIWDFRAVSLGSSALFYWIESATSGSNQTVSLQSRTLLPSGALGNQVLLDSVSVDRTEGRIQTRGLSASSFGGVSNVAWAYSSAQGPASSNCGSGSSYSTTPNTSCSYTRKVRFARLNDAGAVTIPAKDVYSQQFNQNRGISCDGYRLTPSIQSVSSTGEGTVVVDDGCILLSGSAEEGTEISRIGADGSVTQVELLRLGFSQNVSSSSNGSTIVSFGDKVLLVPKSGKVVGPVPSVNDSDSGAQDGSAQVAGLPEGEALATWTSRRASGSDLVLSAWARLIQADGSLGAPTAVYSKTLPAPATPGPTRFEGLDVNLVTGLGRDTGTMLVQAFITDRPTASSSTESVEATAMGINRQGKKVGGTETTLFTDSVSSNLETRSFQYLYSSSSVAVAADGTASVALRNAREQYQVGPSSSSSNQATLTGSKLVRNPNTCGVSPQLCKAKLRVQKLTIAPKQLRSGKKATLSITLRNTGDATAKRAVAKVSSSTRQVKVPKKVTFRNITDGGSSLKKVNLRVKGKATKGRITVKVGGSTKRINFKIR